MDIKGEALKLHEELKGKIEVKSKVEIKNIRGLSLAYTPGVAEPCKEIQKDERKIYQYTSKGNMVAVVTNGTAVLGLGDIGAKASLPVMEGKAVLFKTFADVDAFPICIETKDTDEFVKTVRYLEPVFGGINLEDISAPSCFEIEKRLKQELSIPVFHDDQHGTAIVTAAGLINALKLVGKKMSEIKVVVNGAGAAGIAVSRLLLDLGVKNIILCDSVGCIYRGRKTRMNPYKQEMAEVTNPDGVKGSLKDAMMGADVFIGVSKANTVTKEMVKSMADSPIVFAMANPVPEIMPDEAEEAGAAVIATGRSDFPNQINNVLAFPGVFRGALDVMATDINEEMKVAAAYAIAEIIEDSELTREYIIPRPFDRRVVESVAKAVSRAAVQSKVARGRI